MHSLQSKYKISVFQLLRKLTMYKKYKLLELGAHELTVLHLELVLPYN